MNVIHPYLSEGMWVFDDNARGLVQEPFVDSAGLLIDRLLTEEGIEPSDRGFRMLFSSGPFPNFGAELIWVREGDGGNWYRPVAWETEVWLCPALLRYFDTAPERIYVRLDPRTR